MKFKYNLTAEQIEVNWRIFLDYIERYISSPRKQQLLDFYKKHEDELILMPASHKRAYHNAIPGGYIDHVTRVVDCALRLHEVWGDMGSNQDVYSIEELVFSALNHDLGKMGDGKEYSHIPSKDQWRKDNLGEMYGFNLKIQYMPVPERSLFLLTQEGIKISANEWIAIKTHDGLYDEANSAYLKSYIPETKPRTSLPYIIHQADIMAARIEFEREYLEELNSGQKQKPQKANKNYKINNQTKAKAVKSTVKNPQNFNNTLSEFFD